MMIPVTITHHFPQARQVYNESYNLYIARTSTPNNTINEKEVKEF